MGKDIRDIEKFIKKETDGNPFNVPEKYFEDFEERLLNNLDKIPNTQIEKKNKVISLLKTSMGLAASFLLVFLLVYYPLSEFLPKYLSDSDMVDSTEIELISVESLDEDEFYELLSEDFKKEEIDSDDILDYLIVESSDYEIYVELYN